MPFLDIPMSYCYFKTDFCLFLILWVTRCSGCYVTVVTVQKTTLGLGCAMGKWNCYAVTVTQGVSNPNDRFGVNGTVATVAVARGVSNPVEESFWGRCGIAYGSEP